MTKEYVEITVSPINVFVQYFTRKNGRYIGCESSNHESLKELKRLKRIHYNKYRILKEQINNNKEKHILIRI